MKKNVGPWDKAVRYLIAIILVLVAMYFEDSNSLWLLLLIPAIILAVTATVQFCGLYRLFGINTCKLDVPKE